MAAHELRWRTYLLTYLGEQPRSPPVLYVDNKAMIALCQEHRLEHRTKHIALRYFLARELQQRGQLCLAYVATLANTADVFTKALPPAASALPLLVAALPYPAVLPRPCSAAALSRPCVAADASRPCPSAAPVAALLYRRQVAALPCCRPNRSPDLTASCGPALHPPLPRRPTEPCRPVEPRHPTEPHCPARAAPAATAASAAIAATAATATTAAMASANVLTFDANGRAVDFDVWVDDLQLFLQCDSKDGVSLFDHTSSVSPTPVATADSTVRSQWTRRDAVPCLVVRSHLHSAERAHFGQYKTTKSLYDAVVARYSSPATAALCRLMLPYLFPDLAAFATVADLITHLRTSDAHDRAALPTDHLPP
ncbi:unnamed protein product [Closterium sp. NIES-54]